MLLTGLTIANFRCYESVEINLIDRLMVIVGENDAGKTVILDAVAALMGTMNLVPEDFRDCDNGVPADQVTITGAFILETHDTLPDEYRHGSSRDRFHLERRFTQTGTETLIIGRGFSDSRFDQFTGADNQRQLVAEYHLKPSSNDLGRKAQREELVQADKLQYVERLLPILLSAVQPHLPRIERISSTEYKSPDSMIQRTLKSVATQVIMPINPETDKPEELPNLAVMREQIKRRLNEEIQKAHPILQRIHPKLQSVSVDPVIDFTKSVGTVSLRLDFGDGGQRSLHAFGEGTKKRIWMGLLEWEREVSHISVSGSVIQLYDEPDANLHYQAERQLFSNIIERSSKTELHTQCVVCTHSLTFIDRTPGRAVILVKVEDFTNRNIVRLNYGDDDGIITFSNEVGRALGLTNSALLYERAFLVFEGESEQEALPIIYRSLFNSSFVGDAIVPVNLHSCSAWKSAIEVLLNNRIEMTYMLLDTDCRSPDSSGYIKQDTLAAMQINPNFLKNQVTYIGGKEFEDAFDERIVLQALNAEFPKADCSQWTSADIQAIKGKGDKFSEDLARTVRGSCVLGRRNDAKKPGIAAAIARQCVEQGDVPAALLEVFARVRMSAGL